MGYKKIRKGLQALFGFYLLMKFFEVLWSLIFKAALDGYNFRRALNRTYAAADAPILIHLGFIFNHFYRIYRTNIGASPAADAFIQFGFADKIDCH